MLSIFEMLVKILWFIISIVLCYVLYCIILYCIVLKVQHLIKIDNENCNNWEKKLVALNNKLCWFRLAWAKPFKRKTRENLVKAENSIKIKGNWQKWKRSKNISKNIDKFLRQTKPFTNPHVHKQCTVMEKTQRQAIETNVHLYCMLTKTDNKCLHT